MASRMITECKYRLKDYFQHSTSVSSLTGWYYAGRARLARSHPKRLSLLAKAYAKTDSKMLQKTLAPRIRTLCEDAVAGDIIHHPRYSTAIARPQINRGIILKRPGPNGERGVIHLTPEYNWLRFLTSGTGPVELGERYTFWLTVSWSPADYHLLGLMASRMPGNIFISPGNRNETHKLEAFHPKIKCLPTIASDWILPSLFQPKPHKDRQTDVLMVANWASFKRHWHLFSALRDLPKSTNVTLIGQPDGQFTLARVQRQMKEMGVRQNIQFLENLKVEQVYDQQCDSRISVIFSRREGACVVATESLFANTPVGLLLGATIGSAHYINNATGTILNGDWRTGPQLAAFLEASDSFSPRAWAIENIACDRSLEKVNAVFQQHANLEGRPWTSGLVPFCWKPNPTYIHATDRDDLSYLYKEFEQKYPLHFGVDFFPEAVKNT